MLLVLFRVFCFLNYMVGIGLQESSVILLTGLSVSGVKCYSADRPPVSDHQSRERELDLAAVYTYGEILQVR